MRTTLIAYQLWGLKSDLTSSPDKVQGRGRRMWTQLNSYEQTTRAGEIRLNWMAVARWPSVTYVRQLMMILQLICHSSIGYSFHGRQTSTLSPRDRNMFVPLNETIIGYCDHSAVLYTGAYSIPSSRPSASVFLRRRRRRCCPLSSTKAARSLNQRDSRIV